jgi:hypothetical protein
MNPDRYSVPFGPREPFIFQLVKPGLGRSTAKVPTVRERCQDRNTNGDCTASRSAVSSWDWPELY